MLHSIFTFTEGFLIAEDNAGEAVSIFNGVVNS